MFDSATSHAIYAKEALQVAHMNKFPGGKQLFLQAGQYKLANKDITTQEMSLLTKNPLTGQSTKVQKQIQAILEERGLWPVNESVHLVANQSAQTVRA